MHLPTVDIQAKFKINRPTGSRETLNKKFLRTTDRLTAGRIAIDR